MQCLRRAGREFLWFGPKNTIEFQHNSVRDYISEDENIALSFVVGCLECQKRQNQISTFEAGKKHGHLRMIESIMSNLNSASFQEAHIWLDSIEDGPTGASSSDLQFEREKGGMAIDVEDENYLRQFFRMDARKDDTLRYEVSHWTDHLRAAEQAWPENESDQKLWSK